MARLNNRWLIALIAGVLAITIIIEVTQSSEDPNQPLFVWGTGGSDNGQFSNPEGIAINASGNVFVVDSGNNRVQVFDQAGKFVHAWGTAGSEDGQFQSPHGIALDNQSNVYVVDTGNNRIQVFNHSGSFIRKWGSAGTGNAQFNTPWGVTLDTFGHVFVTDMNNNRVQIFDQVGNFWRLVVGEVAQVVKPRGIVMTSINRFTVTNTEPICFLGQADVNAPWISCWQNGLQLNEPYGITKTKAGDLILADTGNNRVVVITYQDPINPPEIQTVWQGFAGPRGIALNNDTGQVYVTDTGNNRVVVANPLAPYIPLLLFPWIITTIFLLAITIVISIPLHEK